MRTVTALAILGVVSLGLTACADALTETHTQQGSPDAQEERTTVEGDGDIPDGVQLTPFDTDHAAVANLDGELRAAVQDAARRAKSEGITVYINSGWRSAEYQARLLTDAIESYGTDVEARRWVSTPEDSRHVSGDAVDIGSWDAAAWMDEHGVDYGLCRVYDNEAWHFELLTSPAGECPPLLIDASEPR